jgi:uncharacterized protein YlxW (UPF0749 family)
VSGFHFRPARLATAGIFALAGLMFFVSFDTAEGTDIRSDDSMLRLTDLIRERSRTNARVESTDAALRAQVDELAAADGGVSETDKKALERAKKAAGATRISGSGLTVTLADAPPDATARIAGVPEPQPNDLVIHQQDLQAVVNALWKGGARGIKVEDQRLITTSAVRCVGNTLILQGRVYSPPYDITAVGDPGRLRGALESSPKIENYLQYVAAYGLGWDVQEDSSVTLPAYSGAVDLRYADPVG